MEATSLKRGEWDASHSRGENNIFYPQTEVVRFLNQFIAKRNTLYKTTYKIEAQGRALRCLDFACGIGTHAIICKDFGIKAYGVDISEHALSLARDHAIAKGQSDLAERFSLIDNEDQKLNFEDGFFDFVIAEACLDSMPFAQAMRYMDELKRITRRKIYFSAVSAEFSNGAVGDTVVETRHEEGTIQSYFDVPQLEKLASRPAKDFDYLQHTSQVDIVSGKLRGARYHCVIDVSA